jgi:hypothetical protein
MPKEMESKNNSTGHLQARATLQGVKTAQASKLPSFLRDSVKLAPQKKTKTTQLPVTDLVIQACVLTAIHLHVRHNQLLKAHGCFFHTPCQ